jgi:hypothetical protein
MGSEFMWGCCGGIRIAPTSENMQVFVRGKGAVQGKVGCGEVV